MRRVTILGGPEGLAHGGCQVAGNTRNVKRHAETPVAGDLLSLGQGTSWGYSLSCAHIRLM
jgi:hypothetical protein